MVTANQLHGRAWGASRESPVVRPFERGFSHLFEGAKQDCSVSGKNAIGTLRRVGRDAREIAPAGLKTPGRCGPFRSPRLSGPRRLQKNQ